MSSRVLVALIAVAVALLVVGLVIGSTALALVGFFGGVAVIAVLGLAAGGDWIREASRGRFRNSGR
jgi:hypothetical protein